MSTKIYFTPGPSQLYFSVEQHMRNALRAQIPSISHRSALFSEIFKSTCDQLRELLGLSDSYHIFFTASATEVWERIAQNLIEKQSYHLINGSFGQKFGQIAKQNGIHTTEYNPGFGQGFDQQVIPGAIDLISVTLNETSAGFQFDEKDLAQIREQHKEALIALDVVSIAPAVKIDFDLVDTAYFSVQKCFGLPAGLGVWIVNDRALAMSQALESQGRYTGSFHSLSSLHKASLNFQTPETPNVLSIYLLGKVVEDMLQKGKEMMHRDTAYKAALIYQAIEENPFLTPFIQEKRNRSKTVCVAQVENQNDWLIDHFEQMGMIIGKGYGPYKKQHIRIANFPTHSKEQIELFVDKLSACRPN